ncbi:MAG: NERD domain-containing protein [Gammaproteobacteria bacterium]|nr:NERD domain-containing protein [Gammaproteobacteria bacterium]
MLEQLIKAFYNIKETPALMLSAAFLLLLIILYLIRKRISQAWVYLSTQYRLNHLGQAQLSNINCPDGLGEHFIIDRLVLRPDGISLLARKQYPGKIYCADHIDDWTQMIGNKSYPFKNPLFELEYQVKAVSACLPGVDIDGYLFFDDQAEFPKGHPARVIHPKHIPEKLRRQKRAQVEPEVASAWEKMKKIVAE